MRRGWMQRAGALVEEGLDHMVVVLVVWWWWGGGPECRARSASGHREVPGIPAGLWDTAAAALEARLSASGNWLVRQRAPALYPCRARQQPLSMPRRRSFWGQPPPNRCLGQPPPPAGGSCLTTSTPYPRCMRWCRGGRPTPTRPMQTQRRCDRTARLRLRPGERSKGCPLAGGRWWVSCAGRAVGTEVADS